MLCLERVYKYLSCTPDLGLRFSPNNLNLCYWVDASYNVQFHDKMESHTGLAVTIGNQNAPILVKSIKQKVTSRSSTEAELIALDTAMLHILWFKRIYEFLTHRRQSVQVYQDNQSVMTVCKSGLSKTGKLKHVASRYFFIKGMVPSHYVLFQLRISSRILSPNLLLVGPSKMRDQSF